MFLYTRIMIILGVSFYYLRNFNGYEDLIDNLDVLEVLLKVFGILGGGALILCPLPHFLYCCCRSKYFLVKSKTRIGSDSE